MIRLVGLAALSLLAACASIAEQPPSAGQDTWWPSRYGADDTLGALNNLSPAKALAASRLVRTGKTYPLGVVTGPDSPAYPPRRFQLTVLPHGDGAGTPLGSNLATANDDLLVTHMGIGSQIDGLGHMGINHHYYNGLHSSDFVRPDGLIKLNVDALPPIVTRGVLLDMAKHLGQNPVPAGTPFNSAEIKAAARAQGITITSGDVVLFHTGWLNVADTDAAAFMAGEPGLGVDGARYLAGLGVVAVGSDSWAVEVIPFEDPAQLFPVHPELLAKNGVYVLENMDTRALAADQAWEFMFILGQPRFAGSVQAVINPVAVR